ncbi:MAG: hypothetical protein ACYSYV_12700 [Planctomycetota bacterium]|jgi:hypothetical protein
MYQFKNRHAGQKCAILANGVTIEDFPVAKWPYVTIGINRSWEVASSPYQCIIDAKQLQWAVKAGVKFKWLFFGFSANPETEKAKENEKRKRELMKEVDALAVFTMPGHEKRYGLGFCEDLVNGQFFIPNAPYMALQIAAWMGFKEIHFWGLDLHGCKFWDRNWQIPGSTAQLQNRQFKIANRALKKLGVRVINHSKGTHCTAFERA